MKNRIVILIALVSMIAEISTAQDWANLTRFKKENACLGNPAPGEKRVVFMGNSITEGWEKTFPAFFDSNNYINRGISGQTTPQMLIRFRPDVINLKPAVVVILAGTNDIAGNTGPATTQEILGNLVSMAELAQANGIKVILCSVLPVYKYPWKPRVRPVKKIAELNAMIKSYCERSGCIYLDYYAAMENEKHGMKKEYADDGVHPTEAGYEVMMPLVRVAIEHVLK
jgi:lysophospholipase L1-like esterase